MHNNQIQQNNATESNLSNVFYTQTNILASKLIGELSARKAFILSGLALQKEVVILTNAVAMLKFLQGGLRQDVTQPFTNFDKALITLTRCLLHAKIKIVETCHGSGVTELYSIQDHAVKAINNYSIQSWIEGDLKLGDCFVDYDGKAVECIKALVVPALHNITLPAIRLNYQRECMRDGICIDETIEDHFVRMKFSEEDFKLRHSVCDNFIFEDMNKCNLLFSKVNHQVLFRLFTDDISKFLAPITLRCIRAYRKSELDCFPKEIIRTICGYLNRGLAEDLMKDLYSECSLKCNVESKE